jgi:pyridoxine 5-phosphate synthase
MATNQKKLAFYLNLQNNKLTKLSVNINKLAVLRNSRGGHNPDIVKAAIDVQAFGADGVTVHPRPDERHIRYEDVAAIKKVITTELNIEGNCQEKKFIDLVLATQPHQVTLVPDAVGQLTSNHGWDTVQHKDYLTEIIGIFSQAGIRTSIFIDPVLDMIQGAAATGAHRVELYTENFAANYASGNKIAAIQAYKAAAEKAETLGLGVNAGHDLDRYNLAFFAQHVPNLLEVSIGHALICDAIYWGLENTIQIYKRQLM